MAKHSSIGASSASRWFTCPGSVRLCTTVPPKEDTIHSVQGSAAHAAIEDILTRREKGNVIDPWDYLGWEYEKGDLTYELVEEDIESIQQFLDVIDELRASGKFVFHCEAKFSLERLHPGLFGTADVVLMASDLSKLIVIDYKHGAGVPVEVKGNKQLKYYALGAIEHVCNKHKIDYLSVMGWGGVFKSVEIVVVQPRCRHADGAVRRVEVGGPELDAFAEELTQKARETADPNAKLVAGEHCRWCPALAVCPQFNKHTFELAKAEFTPQGPKLPAPETLKLDEVAKVLKYESLISEWLKSVSAYAQHCLEHGENVPGFKLVKKRATRKWTDEAEAQEALEMVAQDPDALYEKSFLSPAKAEKLLGKKAKDLIGSLVTVPDTGVTIAPDHDPREAVAGSVLTDFVPEPEARQ